MRIGCCVPGGSFMPQKQGREMDALERLTLGADMILKAGFDYVESAVGMIMALTEEQLQKARGRVPLEACNSFIPGQGTVINGGEELKVYVREAMRRMTSLGCRLVVFGSGRARSIPEDMSRDEGMGRIRDFLVDCQRAGEEYGMEVVLEPLNKKESNVLNRVSEATELARSLSLSRINVLADAYHMALENEPLTSLGEAGKLLHHVHVAEADRSRPGVTDDLRAVAEALRAMDYKGRVSVECVFKDFAGEIGPTGKYMREVFG